MHHLQGKRMAILAEDPYGEIWSYGIRRCGCVRPARRSALLAGEEARTPHFFLLYPV
jgi:hypothetical protein